MSQEPTPEEQPAASLPEAGEPEQALQQGIQRPEPEATSRRHDMFTALGCCIIFGVAGIFVLILANFLITAVLSFANAPLKTEQQDTKTVESIRP